MGRRVAHLEDLEALQSFSMAYRRHGVDAGQAIGECEAAADRDVSLFETEVERKQQELEELERQIAAAETESDAAYYDRQAEAVRAELSRKEMALSSVRAARDVLAGIARGVIARRRNLQGDGEAYLQRCITRCQAYIDARPQTPAKRSAGIAKVSRPTGTDGLSPSILPEGFEWVRLSSIDVDWDADQLEYLKGVTRDEMSRGVRRLFSEIVPLMQRGALRREDFEEEDKRRGTGFQENGLVHPESLAHLFNQFFHEGNVVKLSPSAEPGRYQVDNGRHRIALAIEAGFEFIPVFRGK